MAGRCVLISSSKLVNSAALAYGPAMGYGLFYLPSSLPATRAEGAERFRTVIEQVAYGEKIGLSPSGSPSITFIRLPVFFPRRR